MSVSIFYCTYKADLKWLDFSLRSIVKFARGFKEVIIVVPLQEVDEFLHLEKKFSTPETPVWIKTFLEFPGKGMVHHEAIICYSDVYCPESDFIFHMDPDCIFIEPVTPNDYFTNGMPDMVVASFESMVNDGCYRWKKTIDDAIGGDALYEAMQRHPAVHYRFIYEQVRDAVEDLHRIPFMDYVLRQKNEYPQTFAEFPTLGWWAMLNYKPSYNIIIKGQQETPRDKIRQSWSHWLRRDPKKADEIFNELESIVS